MVAALSLSLASHALPPEPPAIAVEFVDDVGLESVAAVQESALATQATTTEPEIAPEPEPDLAPPPPDATPNPPAASEATEPAPPRTERPTPRRNPRPTGRLDDLEIDGRDRGNTSRQAGAESGEAAAPVIDAAAMASIQQAIRRQVQPCADLQQNPGPGANQIRVTLNLKLARDGRLISRPRVVRTAGVTPDNARYEDRVRDLAIATYVGCAPLRGLPPELYQTAAGGWSNINMTYRLP
nr:hypothetical protein [Sphingomicrobium sp. B8]